MGCFNGTCVITNLPLVAGEPTVLIPLAFNKFNDRNYTGLVYATDAAYPLTFPIDGAYNDYGAIEDYDEHSIPVKIILHATKIKDFGDFLSAAHEGELKVGNPKLEESPVGYVMAHKKAFDLVVEQFAREEDYDRAASTLKIKTAVLDETPDIQKLVEKYGDKLDRETKLMADLFKYEIPVRLGGFEVRQYDHIISSFVEENRSKAKKKNNKLVETLATLHMRQMAFVRGMNCLRRSIFPPCGSGSQSSYLKSQMKLNNIVSEILAGKVMDSDMNEGSMSYVYNIMLGDEEY